MGSPLLQGTGIITFPTSAIASDFLRHVRENPTKVLVDRKKRLFFEKLHNTENYRITGLVHALNKAPFVDPNIDEEHYNKQRDVNDIDLRVTEVEIEVLYRQSYPVGNAPLSARCCLSIHLPR
jgi:hypothetical protein